MWQQINFDDDEKDAPGYVYQFPLDLLNAEILPDANGRYIAVLTDADGNPLTAFHDCPTVAHAQTVISYELRRITAAWFAQLQNHIA
jgi:hypothetical protein